MRRHVALAALAISLVACHGVMPGIPGRDGGAPDGDQQDADPEPGDADLDGDVEPDGETDEDEEVEQLDADERDAGCLDLDGDGHSDEACGGDDCDDEDDQVHPGRDEVCADEIDNDCDTEIDEGCPVACRREYPPAPANHVCVGSGDPASDSCTDCSGDRHCLRAILLGVEPGSVVLVGPGEYRDIVQMPDRRDLVIEGAEGARINPGSAYEVVHLQPGCRNVVIRGFDISSENGGVGVWLQESQDTTLECNRIHLGPGGHPGREDHGTGDPLIFADGGSRNRILNNEIFYDDPTRKGGGVWVLSGGRDYEVVGNTISAVTTAIEVCADCSARVADNTFGPNVDCEIACDGECR